MGAAETRALVGNTVRDGLRGKLLSSCYLGTRFTACKVRRATTTKGSEASPLRGKSNIRRSAVGTKRRAACRDARLVHPQCRSRGSPHPVSVIPLRAM